MNESHFYESDMLPRAAGGWRRPGGAELTRKAVRLAGLRAGDAVIDVGCGSGETVHLLRSELAIEAVGVDISPALIALGKQKFPGLPLQVGDMEKLPYGDGVFAAALAECVLSLAEHPHRALAEIRRCLRPGGALIVSDVYIRSGEQEPQAGPLPRGSCLQGAAGKREILECFAAAGFLPQCFEDHTPLYKSLIAQLIMDNGSALDFWRPFLGGSPGCRQEAGPQRRRFGYYLALCRAV
ncbi:MAG: methyltransferase domain-containing protein [Firmicutes bacterium]|nr:methyltransferase domain-containing protein [Bacillota bacterium]